jgi:hypothetical protein
MPLGGSAKTSAACPEESRATDVHVVAGRADGPRRRHSAGLSTSITTWAGRSVAQSMAWIPGTDCLISDQHVPVGVQVEQELAAGPNRAHRVARRQSPRPRGADAFTVQVDVELHPVARLRCDGCPTFARMLPSISRPVHIEVADLFRASNRMCKLRIGQAVTPKLGRREWDVREFDSGLRSHWP